MSDMLVKLYSLPPLAPVQAALAKANIEIRPGDPSEKSVIAKWVRHHFDEAWAIGCEVGLGQRPITCYVAVEKALPLDAPQNGYDLPAQLLVGMACYDVASRGMFGPTGVREDYRGRGIGTGLLLACLHAMAAERYAYAIIGWAGVPDFYARTVGATLIPDSEPGIFRGPLMSGVNAPPNAAPAQ
jgi:GNAT superfamily N-acetyltransferase